MSAIDSALLAAVYERATDLVAAGWCQNSYSKPPIEGTENDRFCALGALRRAATELALPARIDMAALEWPLREALGTYVFEWNDSTSRTQADVVTALRCVASTLRSKEGTQ